LDLENDKNSISAANNNRQRGGGYHTHHHHHDRRDPSQLFIDPESSTPNDQINLQGAVKGAVVGIVRARAAAATTSTTTPVFLLLVDDNRGSSSVQSSNPGAYAAHLVTVKHGAFHKLPAAPAALLLDGGGGIGNTINNQSLSPDSKPPLASTANTHHHHHHRRGASGSSGSTTTGWFGGVGDSNSTPGITGNRISSTAQQNTNATFQNNNSTTTSNRMSLGTLPRMSCATYHPNTGYVYASGTGVYGLPNMAVKAVLAGMMMANNMTATMSSTTTNDGISSTTTGGGPFHHSTNASVSSSHSMRQRHTNAGSSSNNAHPNTTNTTSSSSTTHPIIIPAPTALYLKCSHALPLPGVRCSSTGGGSQNSMSLACGGRVAIVAVGNSFYAIPSFLDVGLMIMSLVGAAGGYSDGQYQPVPSTASAAAVASLPNVTATKITTFAQSSQVHPVIAMEVMTSSSNLTPATSATNTNIIQHLRPITTLVFLASGRECTIVEIVSVPDAKAVNRIVGKTTGTISNSTVMMEGGGGMMVSTSIKSMTPKQQQQQQQQHGISMATLPSPIVAAAPLSRISRAGVGGNLSSGPLVALLTVDGLVHIRSPLCVAVPLTSIEVGTRPNDFFSLTSLPCPTRNTNSSRDRTIVATSYGGEARLLSIQIETPQDFADRIIKLSIDAFGPNGFPRLELAEALGATFSATSYVGLGVVEQTSLSMGVQKRMLLKSYLESVLGLGQDSVIGGLSRSSGGAAGHNNAVSFVVSEEDGNEGNVGLEVEAQSSSSSSPLPSLDENSLLTCTALLCLVCHPPNNPHNNSSSSACRASKACASAMGIVRPPGTKANVGISKAAVAVCEQVANRLLKEAPTMPTTSTMMTPSFSLLSSSSSASALVGSRALSSQHQGGGGAGSMEFVESAVWLLRSCGCHEKAIAVLQERMNSPAFRNASVVGGGSTATGGGGWSQIKFDSYLATHLGELWSSNDDNCRQLVLHSSAAKDLIARNPTLGLSVFTTIHPQNEMEWRRIMKDPEEDPLAHPLYPSKVLELLKGISPLQMMSSADDGAGGLLHDHHHEGLGMRESFSTSFSRSPRSGKVTGPLPMDSGRALAVSYLESAIGIATGRPTSSSLSQSASSDTNTGSSLNNFQQPPETRNDEIDQQKADMHDELSYILLEGIISERGDLDEGEDTDLGAIYRFKLRRLLGWPNSKIRSERLLGSLPSSFLREHALLLGRLGRHEDALQILYSKENSLELALEYCDVRHERQMAQQMEEAKAHGGGGAVVKPPPNECAYIPLVKVALRSDPNSDRGIAAAIQVLALRRDSIDNAAALRLLPKNIPMSSVVRPFLIPAVVESESQVRRLTVASSLLRSRYIQLKQKLTEARLKSQASLYSAPALQRLNLGNPLHSSKPTKARPVHAASPYYPNVMLIKHFFSRHLVIQAQVMNNNNAATTNHPNSARTLADVAFVIAESSDEALVPTFELPLKTVPPGATGSVWCVLAASPQRLDGAAFLTCELRFTVLEVDAATGTPLNFSDMDGTGNNNNAATGFGRTYVEELQDIEVRHTEF